MKLQVFGKLILQLTQTGKNSSLLPNAFTQQDTLVEQLKFTAGSHSFFNKS